MVATMQGVRLPDDSTVEGHPEVVVTHHFSQDRAAEAYRVAAAGEAGKVCLVWED